MANLRYRSQFSYSFAGQRVKLLAQVAIGASGAPTLATNTGMGIASITRSATGKYVIALGNSFATLLSVNVISNSGTSAPAAPLVNIVDNSVSSVSAPSVTIQCRDIAAAAADPASGEILMIEVELDRSSAGH